MTRHHVNHASLEGKLHCQHASDGWCYHDVGSALKFFAVSVNWAKFAFICDTSTCPLEAGGELLKCFLEADLRYALVGPSEHHADDVVVCILIIFVLRTICQTVSCHQI